MVPRPQRAAFARKAEMFRMLARLGAKPRSAPRPKAFAPERADTLTNKKCYLRRGTYLRGNNAASLAMLAVMRAA